MSPRLVWASEVRTDRRPRSVARRQPRPALRRAQKKRRPDPASSLLAKRGYKSGTSARARAGTPVHVRELNNHSTSSGNVPADALAWTRVPHSSFPRNEGVPRLKSARRLEASSQVPGSSPSSVQLPSVAPSLAHRGRGGRVWERGAVPPGVEARLSPATATGTGWRSPSGRPVVEGDPGRWRTRPLSSPEATATEAPSVVTPDADTERLLMHNTMRRVPYSGAR